MTAWIPSQVQEEAGLTSFAKNPMHLYLFVFIYLFLYCLLVAVSRTLAQKFIFRSSNIWLKRFIVILSNSQFYSVLNLLPVSICPKHTQGPVLVTAA